MRSFLAVVFFVFVFARLALSAKVRRAACPGGRHTAINPEVRAGVSSAFSPVNFLNFDISAVNSMISETTSKPIYSIPNVTPTVCSTFRSHVPISCAQFYSQLEKFFVCPSMMRWDIQPQERSGTHQLYEECYIFPSWLIAPLSRGGGADGSIVAFDSIESSYGMSSFKYTYFSLLELYSLVNKSQIPRSKMQSTLSSISSRSTIPLPTTQLPLET